MKVHGVEITDEQIAAGLAAMSGEFRFSDVQAALIRAGVAYDGDVSMRAADRLLQRERKADRITAVSSKLWAEVLP